MDVEKSEYPLITAKVVELGTLNADGYRRVLEFLLENRENLCITTPNLWYLPQIESPLEGEVVLGWVMPKHSSDDSTDLYRYSNGKWYIKSAVDGKYTFQVTPPFRWQRIRGVNYYNLG